MRKPPPCPVAWRKAAETTVEWSFRVLATQETYTESDAQHEPILGMLKGLTEAVTREAEMRRRSTRPAYTCGCRKALPC